MPISFLLTTIVCLFIANTVSEFSRYMPSSGGYYSFATRGLGSRVGFIATWSYLIYDILGPAASSGFLGYLLSDTLQSGFGVRVPWWLIAVATFAVVVQRARILLRSARQASAAKLDYGAAGGDLALRESICVHLQRSRAVAWPITSRACCIVIARCGRPRPRKATIQLARTAMRFLNPVSA